MTIQACLLLVFFFSSSSPQPLCLISGQPGSAPAPLDASRRWRKAQEFLALRFTCRRLRGGGGGRRRRDGPEGTELFPAEGASLSACSFNSSMKLPCLDTSA